MRLLFRPVLVAHDLYHGSASYESDMGRLDLHSLGAAAYKPNRSACLSYLMACHRSGLVLVTEALSLRKQGLLGKCFSGQGQSTESVTLSELQT
jgi:hypothetical protein